MKKNITINLFGTLYNIDEDAYQLLESYLQSMKRYFGSKDGGDEIANDIEHRVAELLWEKKEQGMEAVNLDVIKEIINTIGNAEEIGGMDNAETTDGSTPSPENGAGEQTEDTAYADDGTVWQRIRRYFRYRYLYRDPDNCLLGGVCSGIAHYLGFGDPVLWRLLMVLMFFLQGSGLIAYILLWLIIPLARTPEDKLRMKGIKPSPDSINRQILQEHTNNENCNGGNRNSTASGCLKVILGLILLPPLFLLLIFLTIALGAFGVIGSVATGLTGNMLATFITANGVLLFSGIVCIAIIIGLCIYGLIRLLFSGPTSLKPRTKWTLIIIAGLCLLWAVYSISYCTTKTFSIRENLGGIRDVLEDKNRVLTKIDIPYLTETQFTIEKNNTARCTWAGDYPTGDGEKRYLDASNYKGDLIFTATKGQSVTPGVYDLYVLARAEDEGAFIYAETHGVWKMTEIPEEGNQHGNLWSWACGKDSLDFMKEAYPALCTDSVRQQIASANEGKGFGWSVVKVGSIETDKNYGFITYGITTDPSITKKQADCDWVSATDFVLVQTKKY